MLFINPKKYLRRERMRKVFFLAGSLFLFLFFTGGCKSFTWDPTGIWTFIYPNGDSEQITFAGDTGSGTISNWCGDQYYPQNGTWEKTGDFSLSVLIDFISHYSSHVTVTFTFTSSEDSPNQMTGSAHFVEDSYVEDFPLQAVKESNLQ